MAARLPAAARRRQLLDIALAEFAEQGFSGVSMDRVAEAAGVTKPVLYQHFRSKRALYLELVDDVADRLESAVVKATADVDSPREQVEAGFRVYFRFVTEHRDAYRLLFSADTRRDGELTEAVLRVEETFAHAIAGLIDVEGLSDDDRLLLARGIVGIAEVTSRQSLAGSSPDPDAVAHRVATLAWAGLRGVRASPEPPA
ncbi:TetR/AcrR family transcriptional regulator [Iamia majanohamensis]|uniref:TetR/AcrR family transcriptional regulator n=1 Tax=Iamia majanohamensis TaxID=467976 RepID=A0AAE9Y8F5_9ACTN|nr:TetR/AcrR family transcriptional regulator [Iamia majanohamensis]WCO67651.1 TetR/AcrR family transcriptional regulator [Iamia majanohamensis]